MAGGAHLETEIGVLVVGRRKLRAEAPHPIPHLAGDGQGGAAHIIGKTGVTEAWLPWITAFAVIPRLAIAPNNAAGLLEAAIWIDQLGTGNAGIRPALEYRLQFIQPEGAGLGVVVEQHHQGGSAGVDPRMTGLIKTAGEAVAHHRDAGRLPGQGLVGVVGGAVVDDDHLKTQAIGGKGQGRQTAAGEPILAVHRHHHTHLGVRGIGDG